MSCPTSPLDKSLPPLPPKNLLRALPPIPPRNPLKLLPIRPRSPFTTPPPFWPLPATPTTTPIPASDPRRLSQASTLQDLTQPRDSSRRDSFTLPPTTALSQNSGLTNPNLDLNNLHLLTQEGFYHVKLYPAVGSSPSQIQYWLRAEDVLVGLPGKDRVPAGHWSKLVQLAQETSIGQRSGQESERKSAEVQEVSLLTALYTPGQEEGTVMDVVDTKE
ncbi:hypothetical protein TRIATDRAFT_308695 [Trichoderma atroviride IMI 206040]|uniref:Uncharacterized protein n=1 Tax=Hypocrea atroviridis (strain ATCC 20476 / IMI 206040) TaxID=452589 RepID=G9NVY4_HYPAI|nr:uncharacterized protein TRIATDRAFT_308695 [Trichoderma atroviride IMI 206040]EHK45152.1 hypothetical protein TRIATDRAFT_308695 [Trichoderma atroviride IMI 206040]